MLPAFPCRFLFGIPEKNNRKPQKNDCAGQTTPVKMQGSLTCALSFACSRKRPFKASRVILPVPQISADQKRMKSSSVMPHCDRNASISGSLRFVLQEWESEP